ncbi:hypothetical protein SmJEL517_g02650 [Synchytrium microbalum]|uniref:AAA+ ATPase domain-containing protein n=1 Tax=Synchytrium microbalum TaxID=1806994 RepID=A0A507C6W6_9FUNG|nr:uncharacterized protein SmJEL517_g02650 [Synchytrium microbalum]TPX34869.1 hypothetical protein SmJEL517_g02650 [Synchytrium microbalum]
MEGAIEGSVEAVTYNWKRWSPQGKRWVVDIAIFAVSQVVLYFGVQFILSAANPLSKQRETSRQKSAAVFKRMGWKDLKLTEHEEIIASEIIHPEDIHVTFKDIGGLDLIVDSLKETVIYPLVYPQLFSFAPALLAAPKGVLLYGPPGCGKTMLAKALAKESGATFVNLHMSTLTEKWFGESQKLVHAIFSLAKRPEIQPTIIFIDEIDAFLRSRQSRDHEATSMMKAEFMSLWDGLATGSDMRVLILGATNRPQDIDKAILRRMPKRFSIKTPDPNQRRKILTLLLKDVSLDSKFQVEDVVTRTEGYSGADLKELCRNALMVPVRESIKGLGMNVAQIDVKSIRVRPVQLSDFEELDQVVTNNLEGIPDWD